MKINWFTLSLSRCCAVLFLVAVLGLQLKLASLGGFPVTIVPLITLFIGMACFNFRVINVSVFFVFLILFLCVVGNNFFLVSMRGSEFNYTYFLFLYNCAVWISALAFRVNGNQVSIVSVRVLVLVVFLFSLLQFVSANFFGDMSFHRLMEPFSYYEKLLHPDVIDGVVTRSFGFYLEPSYLALVSLFLICMLFLLGENGRFYYLIAYAIAFLALSATGLLVISVQLTMLYMLKKCSASKRVILIVPCGVIIGFSALEFVPRLNEIFIPGTSGYYRYVVPFEVAKCSLFDYPAGIAIGTISEYVAGFGYMNGGKLGTSIDNGVFAYAIYFGWLGVVVLFVLFLWMVRSFFGRGVRLQYLYVVLSFFLFSLLFNGGIFSVEFVFMVFMLIVVFRQRLRNDKCCDGRI